MFPSRHRTPADALTLGFIPIFSTLVAFGVLGAGRQLVSRAGVSSVRTTLVRESDQIASRQLPDMELRSGCLPVKAMPIPYERCVALTSLSGDSVRVTIRVEPMNRLLSADSVSYTAIRAGN